LWCLHAGRAAHQRRSLERKEGSTLGQAVGSPQRQIGRNATEPTQNRHYPYHARNQADGERRSKRGVRSAGETARIGVILMQRLQQCAMPRTLRTLAHQNRQRARSEETFFVLSERTKSIWHFLRDLRPVRRWIPCVCGQSLSYPRTNLPVPAPIAELDRLLFLILLSAQFHASLCQWVYAVVAAMQLMSTCALYSAFVHTVRLFEFHCQKAP
jgi:hypothetical protein